MVHEFREVRVAIRRSVGLACQVLAQATQTAHGRRACARERSVRLTLMVSGDHALYHLAELAWLGFGKHESAPGAYLRVIVVLAECGIVMVVPR